MSSVACRSGCFENCLAIRTLSKRQIEAAVQRVCLLPITYLPMIWLVLGLGNEFLDFTGDASSRVERAGALVNGGSESETWQLYADRIAAIAPYIRTRTVGSNPANNLTFALIAHRDAKTNAWSDQALLPLPPREPPPVSVPPWWRMAKKNAMFNMGEGRGDHARIMMSASMLCTDSVEALEAIDVYAPDIRAYIASLKAPEWPFAIDADLQNRIRDWIRLRSIIRIAWCPSLRSAPMQLSSS